MQIADGNPFTTSNDQHVSIHLDVCQLENTLIGGKEFMAFEKYPELV